MAKLAEENVLDYRRGGDTVADFAQKYMAEITRIYQFLNNLRSHNTSGPEQVEPDSYQIIVEDNKLKIRNEANTEWITLMKVEQNGGFTSETFGKLTSGDGSSMPTTGVNTYDTYWDTAHGKMYMWLNGSWQLLLSLNVTDLTGYDTLITTNDVVSTETVTHTPNKLVRTNANGVLPVDVLGNAGMIAGIRNEVNNLSDGQVLTYREASNSWRNEPKGVVGAGASLIINDGETQLAEYSGDEHKEVDVGVTSGITAHNSNANAHANLAHYTATDAHADLFRLRKASTAYAVGDIAFSALLPSWARLECVTAGTTASTDITVPTPTTAGQYITDGTVTWIIDDVRDGDRVGDITLRPTLRDGHILADRSVVVASEYPRLVAFVVANDLVTTDSTDVSKYLYDSENDTLTVPDMTGRVLQGGSAVEAKEAGLPNITTGTIGAPYHKQYTVSAGAFRLHNTLNPANNVTTGNWFDGNNYGDFDASRCSDIYGASNTVQPSALVQIAQIKY